MKLLDEIMQANANYLMLNGVVPQEEPVPGPPQRKVAIFTCMDGRLVELLEPAMGISRGDAHVLKNAGNTLVDADGGIIRSLVVSIFVLGVEEILVVGHRDCGMANLNTAKLEEDMLARGIPKEAIGEVEGLRDWLGTFSDPAQNVRNVVRKIANNPLIPADVPVHGLIVEPQKGALSVIVDGYPETDAAPRPESTPRGRERSTLR